MTAPDKPGLSNEELKPCPWCGEMPTVFGQTDAYRCEPCMKNSGWMSKKDWNHRHATEEQGLREFLEEMEHADFNCDCRSEDEEFPGQKESVCSWHTRIKAALSNAPAPQIICTCREGSSLPEGQHFVGCGLYKFPVPESERHT